MAASTTPPAPPVNVSFAVISDKPTVKEGLTIVPDSAISALVSSLDPGETMESAELVAELTRQYGGNLLGNAIKVRELTGLYIKDLKAGLGPRLAAEDPVPAENMQDKPQVGPRSPLIVKGRVLHFVPDVQPSTPDFAGTGAPPSGDDSFNVDVPRPAPVPTHMSPVSPPVTTQQGSVGMGSLIGRNPAVSPLPPALQGQDALLSPTVYRIDRISNPDSFPTPGNLQGGVGGQMDGQNTGLCGKVLRSRHVALRPGAVGPNLPIGLKSMSDRFPPLYDAYKIATGFTNRLRMGGGGGVGGPFPALGRKGSGGRSRAVRTGSP